MHAIVQQMLTERYTRLGYKVSPYDVIGIRITNEAKPDREIGLIFMDDEIVIQFGQIDLPNLTARIFHVLGDFRVDYNEKESLNVQYADPDCFDIVGGAILGWIGEAKISLIRAISNYIISLKESYA
jgi:hypothetical protein